MTTLMNVDAIMKAVARDLGFEEPVLTRISRKTRDPFRVLVSCILSLRTRDQTTAAASKRLFARARTVRTLGALPARVIEKAIYPVGFYRTKARHIIEICGILLDRHGGTVPDTLEDLLALPGVGRKTANIVLVYGFGKAGLPIDTHCHRIPNRIGWINTKSPEETEKVLRKSLPRKYWPAFNDLFVQFGQNLCRPIGPRCDRCPIYRYCARVGVKSGKKGTGKTGKRP